jgi:hypothetical protein
VAWSLHPQLKQQEATDDTFLDVYAPFWRIGVFFHDGRTRLRANHRLIVRSISFQPF